MENIKLKSLTKENAKDYLEMINEEPENSKVRDFAVLNIVMIMKKMKKFIH